MPVLYLDESDLKDYYTRISTSILNNREWLQEKGQAHLVGCIMQMLIGFAVATKHPGFAEEQEWRSYYRPTEYESPEMTSEIVVLNGVPQKIYKLRLAHAPEDGLHGADIPALIDRVILGPTQFPYVSFRAF